MSSWDDDDDDLSLDDLLGDDDDLSLDDDEELIMYGRDEEKIKSLRGSWEFHYAPTEVLKAVEAKIKHHQERLDWWTSEQEQAETKLKEKGFDYRENFRSGGSDVVIVGDPELAKRTKDCSSKVREHQEQIKTYESWVRALTTKVQRAPDTPLTLWMDDILFFGL
ncbi:hypothetical protein BGP_0965 [Beggiatoa sp. PS]|nr:hypothetical protein BGP_0965 [Beggiatoa sp. PS]